jgi:hypothetical protein
MEGEAGYGRENLIAISPRQVEKGRRMICAVERVEAGRESHHHQG